MKLRDAGSWLPNHQGRYGEERLSPVADRLRSWLDQGCDVYAYFNNDDSGFAVQDAQWLSDRLRR